MDSKNMKYEYTKVTSYETDPCVVSYIKIDEIQCLSVSESDNGDTLMPAVIKFINGSELEIDYESYIELKSELLGRKEN